MDNKTTGSSDNCEVIDGSGATEDLPNDCAAVETNGPYEYHKTIVTIDVLERKSNFLSFLVTVFCYY